MGNILGLIDGLEIISRKTGLGKVFNAVAKNINFDSVTAAETEKYKAEIEKCKADLDKRMGNYEK